MSSAAETAPASGFAASTPSSLQPSRPPAGGVRYRHRPHALAPEREYRIGAHTLRWHHAGRPDQGVGRLALSQIESMRLEVQVGRGGARRGRLTLLAAAGLGVGLGPLPALAGLLLAWPLTARLLRWHQGRHCAPLPRGPLPRQLLP